MREDLMQWRSPLFVGINGILRSCIISNNKEGQTRRYFARRSEVGGPSENVTYFIISDLFQDEV